MADSRWTRTPLTERLGARYPIFLAPMAGGPSTPALVAACNEAGAFGTAAGAYLTPEALRAKIRAIRALTRLPFAVNLFAPQTDAAPFLESLAAAQAALGPYRAELGLPDPPLEPPAADSFDALFNVLLEERPAAFSFTFGIPPASALHAARAAGIFLIGTATTVAEGRALAAARVDAIAAQGSEAGAHRGTFLPVQGGPPLVGTLALVPQLVDAVAQIPVIAAGGIMDGRGIAAALALGAQGAMLGTAFLRTKEAGTNALHRQALASARDDNTAVTNAFTGRYARGLITKVALDQAQSGFPLAPFPAQMALYKDLKAAAQARGRTDLLPLWAGQAAALGRELPAGELIAALVRETDEAIARLGR